MTSLKSLPSLLAAALVLGACSSTPVEKPTPAPVTTATPVAPASPRAPATAPAPVTTQAAVPAHLDPNSAISRQRSVYFDFDDYSIKPQYTSLLEIHAKYLGANPSLAIKVEGNADERGSKEYNLALGQKRAEAVVKALGLLGVKGTQMEAVSWGEEKPVATGHDETAWAQNRRADLRYPKQ
jgi:peptidoglycan-associated lipoprotein